MAPPVDENGPASRGAVSLAPAFALAMLLVGGGSCALDAPSLALSGERAEELAPRPADAGLLEEVVPLTQSLIRARPVNPPGGESAVVAILADRLRAEGIAVDVQAFAEGRDNLLATLPGQDPQLPPVVLLGHSDVVPAVAADWDSASAPFDAVVLAGELRGRGALDMLGMVALETLTLVALKDNGPLLRDVLLLVTGDEESGGLGAEAAFRSWPRLAEALVVWNEGGVILESGAAPGRDLIAVSVAEKGAFWFDLVTEGEAGHGSLPHEGDAPARLTRAVHKVLTRPDPPRITPPAERMLAALGRARGGLQGFVLERPLLVGSAGVSALEERGDTRVIIHDTCALTVLAAGQKTNIIPSTARATFDCRLLPGTAPEDFRDELLLVIDDPRVRLSVERAWVASGSPPEGPLVKVLATHIGGELAGSAVVPLLTRGFTDSRAFRARGVPAYGLVPVRVTADELAAVHGVNERVRVEELKAGLSRMVDVTRAMAREP